MVLVERDRLKDMAIQRWEMFNEGIEPRKKSTDRRIELRDFEVITSKSNVKMYRRRDVQSHPLWEREPLIRDGKQIAKVNSFVNLPGFHVHIDDGDYPGKVVYLNIRDLGSVMDTMYVDTW